MLAICGAFAWAYLSQSTRNTPDDQYVNLEKSDTENKDIEELQEDPSKKTENNQADTPVLTETNNDNDAGLREVNILVTNASSQEERVSASGFVTNVAEEGGTCTYVFTRNGKEVRKDSSTLPNPTSTTCKTVDFPSTELGEAGEWEVYIRYTSTYSTGVSKTRSFVL